MTLFIKEKIEDSFTYQQINPREVIFKHLKFNYYSIGKSNKLEILDKWLNELNLKYICQFLLCFNDLSEELAGRSKDK